MSYMLRQNRFFLILSGIVLLCVVVASWWGYRFFLGGGQGSTLRLVVVAPRTGVDADNGESIRRGAELYVQHIKKIGGMGGRPVSLQMVDEDPDPTAATQKAEQIASQADVVAVAGYWSRENSHKTAEVYAKAGIPLITLASAMQEEIPDNPWLFHLPFDETFEVRFLANYVRNIIGEKLISVLHPRGEHGEQLARTFDETLQRFGSKVLFTWPINSSDPTADLEAVAAEIKDKKVVGSLLVLGDAAILARMVTALRTQGIRNRLLGTRQLASTAFMRQFVRQWKEESASVSATLNGSLITTPLLFDAMGELAQNFRAAYLERFQNPPDWLASCSYDAVRLIEVAYNNGLGAEQTVVAVRRGIRDYLAAMNSADKAVEGNTGPILFDQKRTAAITAMVGQYDGTELVASLTQLWPIREEGMTNYLDEIVAGRALYVNDRFMYKTNVVYTGVRIEKVTALDVTTNTSDIDFTIWFRWRGAFEPQDLIFINAAAPIKIDQPEREGKNGDMLYRSYRLTGRFFLNYSKVERAYGSQLLGISFRHKSLSRNNLMYVSDILGMDISGTNTLTQRLKQDKLVHRGGGGMEGQPAEPSAWQRIANSILKGASVSVDPLVELLTRARVLAALSGWVIDRAWISQESVLQGSNGDPYFVGFGKQPPSFSVIDTGVILKPDAMSARDFITPQWFILLALLSFVGTATAIVLDHNTLDIVRRIKTFAIRLLCWPVLLLSLGNIVLDYALQYLSSTNIDMVAFIYSVLWWLVPARLLAMALERFIWAPMENHTGRKIPNVVRRASSILIYTFATFGVVAFVMGKAITSLLATTGLTAMIIGLAVQSNIANIFSGIILNIERPFSIGDLIRINTLSGQVMDITWRTTRIRSDDGQMIAVPNGKVSEAEVHNFSNANGLCLDVDVYIDPKHDPERVQSIIEEGVSRLTLILREHPDHEPSVCYVGVELVNGVWVSRFRISVTIIRMSMKKKVLHELWGILWPRFVEAKIIQKHVHEEEDAAFVEPNEESSPSGAYIVAAIL